MELQIRKDYNLENLVKDWGFEKREVPRVGWNVSYWAFSEDKSSFIQVWKDRDVLLKTHKQSFVDDETLCLLYDLIQAGIIIKE